MYFSNLKSCHIKWHVCSLFVKFISRSLHVITNGKLNVLNIFGESIPRLILRGFCFLIYWQFYWSVYFMWKYMTCLLTKGDFYFPENARFIKNILFQLFIIDKIMVLHQSSFRRCRVFLLALLLIFRFLKLTSSLFTSESSSRVVICFSLNCFSTGIAITGATTCDCLCSGNCKSTASL